MAGEKKSLRRRPDRKRAFTAAEDEVILSYIEGRLSLTRCFIYLNSSVVAVKRRAEEICAAKGLEAPVHKAKKKYPKYQGLDDSAIDTADFKATVGADPLLSRLQAGLR